MADEEAPPTEEPSAAEETTAAQDETTAAAEEGTAPGEEPTTAAEETTTAEEGPISEAQQEEEGAAPAEEASTAEGEAAPEAAAEESKAEPTEQAASKETLKEKPSAAALEKKKGSSVRSLPRIASSGVSKTKVLGSVISFKKGSAYDLLEKGKAARYMNTYKLYSDHPFSHAPVEKILQQVVKDTIETLVYDPEKCPKLCKWASGAIRSKVKELQFDRYKLVCIVTIGEKRSQDMLTMIRFLWDLERDSYAYYMEENTTAFMLAMCFGLYYE